VFTWLRKFPERKECTEKGHDEYEYAQEMNYRERTNKSPARVLVWGRDGRDQEQFNLFPNT
jgi:hypothetical protein